MPSDVEDDVNLQGRVLIVLSQACDSLILTPPLRFSDGFSARTQMASFTPRSNHRVSVSIILTYSKSVLCLLAFKWSKTAETLDPEVCYCNLCEVAGMFHQCNDKCSYNCLRTGHHKQYRFDGP